MKLNDRLRLILRTTLGVFLILYALNKFFHVVPSGYGEMNENVRDFIDGVAIYLPYLYIFEILIGLCLILNKWTALILIILFPLSFAFMFFSIANQDLTELWPAVFVALLNIILIYHHKDKYTSLLKA